MLKKFLISLTVLGFSSFNGLAIAQVPPPSASQQSLQEFQQPNQSNLSFGGSSGTNLLQLIQNVNLMNSRSAAEVMAGQRETIDEASAEFRKQQRQQLGVTSPLLK